jgi:hypothetical protein
MGVEPHGLIRRRAVHNDACRSGQATRGEGHREGQHRAEQDAADAIDWALYVVDRADYAEVDEVIARIADDLALNT